MNNLDDFLRSKISNASVDIPSKWEALNAALPVQTPGKGIAKWAFALLLLGGLATTAIVFKYNTRQATIADKPGVSTPIASNNTEPVVTSGSLRGDNGPEVIASPSVANPVSPSKLIYEEQAPAPIVPADKITATSGGPEKSSPTVVKSENESNKPVVKNNDNVTVHKSSEPKQDGQILKPVDEPKLDAKTTKPADAKSVSVRKKSRSEFHNGKLYASLSFSSIFSYRSFELNNGAAPFVNKNYDELRQNSEAMDLGYGTSLALEYKFSKSFSLQGGISYNKIGYKSRYDFEVTDKAVTNASGRVIGYENLPSPVTVSSRNRTKIDVLRIPIGLNYNLFLSDKMLFHFYAGGSHNILLSADGVGLNQLELTEQKITKADFVKTAKEVCFDLGVNIALSADYGFGIDLYYNKWLTNISKNKYENLTPFSPGVNFAISRKLF